MGRRVEGSDNGLVPAEGGVEQGGGEEEREGVIGTGFGRVVMDRMGVGDEGVGAGEGVAEESGVCFGGEEDGMCTAVGVGTDCVNAAVFAEIACGMMD